MMIDLSGYWDGWAEELGRFRVKLPGTLDTNRVGLPDTSGLKTRLTRLYTYEGQAHFTRRVLLPGLKGQRLFLEAERARELELLADGKKVPVFQQGTLSTPYIFDLTEFAGREVMLELVNDNRYLNWYREGVLAASAATDETQTNWNGILGYLRLRVEERTFVERVRVYPFGNEVRVETDIFEGEGRASASQPGLEDTNSCRLELRSEAFAEGTVSLPVEAGCGRRTVMISHILLREDIRRWDEGEGFLYEITARYVSNGVCADKKAVFGVRDFGVNDKLRLTVNGRAFFLRGEANCCVFPEEGHPPVTVEGWKRVLAVYASYGVNCLRFHSWCPPRAAFCAADEMGMMLQPELSQWNFKNALEDDGGYAYYHMELRSILLEYANHPSFVMLTLGNELQAGEKGHARMDELLGMAKSLDSTRLYANSSNGHYGEKGTDRESDFYTSAAYFQEILRATSSPMIGHLNRSYPSAKHNYQEAAVKVLGDGKPVFGFEVGQYEILPEFSEIGQYQGVTRAVNLELARERVKQAGYQWEKAVEATGELALICYREEVEAVLRTPAMSGLSLLGLQDFPGQGSALVGMLDSHLNPKPYGFAAPESFRRFFAPVVPLLLLDKYTYRQGEILRAQMKLANYGKTPLEAEAGWRLREAGLQDGTEECGNGGRILQQGVFPQAHYENQGLAEVGQVVIDCGKVDAPRRLEVDIWVGEFGNSYPLWIYPERDRICIKESQGLSAAHTVLKIPDGAEACDATGEDGAYPGVRIATRLTDQVLQEAAAGARIYLEPEPVPENMPGSIGGWFSTNFWSIGTFPEQEGGMGMVIDTSHPALGGFPTEAHCNWQWWQMASGRPMILPSHIRPILTVPDSWSRMRHMGLLFEAGYGKGCLLVSGMGLLCHQDLPEASALLHSLLSYLEEIGSMPEQEISQEELYRIFGKEMQEKV